MPVFGTGARRCAAAGIALTRSAPTARKISLARIVTSLIDELYSTISHRRPGISKHRARAKLYRKQKADATETAMPNRLDADDDTLSIVHAVLDHGHCYQRASGRLRRNGPTPNAIGISGH
jgi:hypothetical protein